METPIGETEPSMSALPTPPWKWSISEAGDWLVQTWQAVTDIPYIGLISLFLAGFLALILLTKVLR